MPRAAGEAVSEVSFKAGALALAEKYGCSVQTSYNPPDERVMTFRWFNPGDVESDGPHELTVKCRRVWMLDECFKIADGRLAEAIYASRSVATEQAP